MKILNGCAALAAATVLLSGCNSEGSLPRADGVPQSDGEKQSYALGQNMGRNLAAAKDLGIGLPGGIRGATIEHPLLTQAPGVDQIDTEPAVELGLEEALVAPCAEI